MIRLHHVQYGRSFRVLWLLEEIGLDRIGPLEIVEHRIGSPEMAESDLARVSPALRIPAIEMDGLEMSESGAIVQLLSERYAPDLDRPADHPDRAAYLQWMGYAETQASLIENLNLQMVFLRPPAKPSAVVVKLTVARLRQTMRGLEARLGDHPWLLASGFSAVDIMMGFNLFALPFYVDMEPFPGLRAYSQRVSDRAAHKRAVAREGPQRFYAKPFYPVPEA
ncbi:glutathione S-transferase family protein [Marivita sp. S0852]|uniref:glutathione S-transferase family protein n=1 Tax=Marivita sp. S0852 TaxID=3373893 RepID=UPI00398277AE